MQIVSKYAWNASSLSEIVLTWEIWYIVGHLPLKYANYVGWVYEGRL